MTFWKSYYREKVIANESRKRQHQGSIPIPKVQFEISKFQDFTYSLKNGVVAHRTVKGLSHHTFDLRINKKVICALPADPGRVKRILEKNQKACIIKLLNYIPNTSENRKC